MTGTLRLRRLRLALAIVATLSLAAPVAARAQCDLAAAFVSGGSATVPTGSPVGLTVRLSNLAATGDCAANQVRLRRTGGTGVAAVTAPMAFQPLPALAPAGVAMLTFLVQSSQPGTYVYEVEYATPHTDADGGNHHPTRTVTFSAPAVTLALPDLTVTSVRAVDGLRVGRCNTVNVTLRNGGTAVAAATQLVLFLKGPLPGTALVDRHAIDVTGFAAGESRTMQVPSVWVPGAGSWRLEATADAIAAVAESSETNNTLGVKVEGGPAACRP